MFESELATAAEGHGGDGDSRRKREQCFATDSVPDLDGLIVARGNDLLVREARAVPEAH